MELFQVRVVVEKEELDVKISRLSKFLISDVFKSLPVAEQLRLMRQHNHMTEYSIVLGERIAYFPQ